MDQVVFANNTKDGDDSFQTWIDEIAAVYNKKQKQAKAAVGPKIVVNQTLSSLAIIYEKIRNAVDFRAEHLFRRNATERILRRRWTSSESKKIAKNLIKELVWSRYLDNDTVPEKTIPKIAKIIDKYHLLKKHTGNQNYDWILGAMAAEIDTVLVDQQENEVWVKATASWFNQYYHWNNEVDQKTKNILLYIAVHRTLVKSDEATIRYYLLSHFYPGWQENDEKTINQVAGHFSSIRKQIDDWLKHPFGNPLFRYLKRIAPPFLILKEVIEKTEPEKIGSLLEETNNLDRQIAQTCARHYQETKTKVKRGITRSIIYIFATKMVFALLLEIPVDIWYYQRATAESVKLFSREIIKALSFLPIAVNLLFPPFLMFLIGFLIRTPDEENTKRIIEKVHSFVYPLKTEKTGFWLTRKKTKSVWEKVFGVAYLVLFFTVFTVVYSTLKRIGFNPASSAIFFFFVCLVLLFGFRVRWTAQELMVTDQKQSLWETIINLLALPFLDVGFKLSATLSKFNFIIFFLDFLIEAPLKSIIQAIGEWASLIRKKQEEVVEVPFQ